MPNDNSGHVCIRARVDLACLLAEVAASILEADTPLELAFCCDIALDMVGSIDFRQKKKPGD